MKATIDIPDDLYRRVKARTAQEGRRIREVTVELFLQWLEGTGTSQVAAGIPVVKPAQLRRHRDAESLHAAYPSSPIAPSWATTP